MRAAGALILFVFAAVLFISAHEQREVSLVRDSEVVQSSTSRTPNSAGGEILHVFKASHENEHRVQIETAVGAALWFAKIASGAKTHVSTSIASGSREPRKARCGGM